MNIGIFTDTYYPEVNGVANSVYQLKAGLERLGHTVYVFTVTHPDADEAHEDHVIRLASVPFLFLKERRVAAPLVYTWKRRIEALHLDIIHTQTEFGMGHLGRKTAQYLGIPHIHTYHTIYEDYTHYLKIPGNEKLKGIVRSFSRHCCEHADQVIVPTEKVRKLLNSYQITTPMSVIPTGIPMAKFAAVEAEHVEAMREKYHLGGKHVLIYIGRVSQEKNLEEILEMFEMISKEDGRAVLLIVGDGPQRQALEAWTRAHELERKVIFTGMVPWDHIQDYYALGDVFVSTSNSETQGLTYAESMAAGVPLLVRRDPCLEGLLKNGVNGCDFESAETFKQGYQRIIGILDTGGARQRIQKSVETFGAELFSQRVEEVYCELIWRYDRYEKIVGMAGQA